MSPFQMETLQKKNAMVPHHPAKKLAEYCNIYDEKSHFFNTEETHEPRKDFCLLPLGGLLNAPITEQHFCINRRQEPPRQLFSFTSGRPFAAMAETAPIASPAVASPAAKAPAKKAKQAAGGSKAKKPAGPSVTELITQAVSASQDRKGLSLAALKKALAVGGYDVEKSNSRIKLGLKSLVNKGILVQTKGTGASGSFKLGKKPGETKAPKKAAAAKPKKPKLPAAAKKSPKKPAAGTAKKAAAKSPKKAKPVKAKKVVKSPAKAKAMKPKVAKPKATKANKAAPKK
ncbi:histone H1-like [Alligator sinensis]|uniref:Histone H1-like n=1 Tax=Alligator sinensis TaxID=38654 RepID=A0A1U7S4G3_ALLSI|nr:histone H1-like [Alligator sinensis]